MKTKVTKLDDESIEFDNGVVLSSYHESDCCEHHWLSCKDLTLDDFDGLEFDLESDELITKVPDYGIELNPVKGFPVRIPGYGSNNGYYSDNLTLTLKGDGIDKSMDISECQVIDG